MSASRQVASVALVMRRTSTISAVIILLLVASACVVSGIAGAEDVTR